MILTDATNSLRRLLQSLLPEGGAVFSGSLAHWQTAAASQPHGIGLFLHRIEEIPTGMGSDWHDLRDDAGRVVARGGPARRFRLSYLLWAWSEHDTEEETRLLSEALGLLAAYQQLPSACLSGSPARLALAPEGLAAPDAVWSAAGLAQRTSFQVVLTTDLLPDPVAPAPLVEERRLHTATTAAPPAGIRRGAPSRTEKGR
ncbi:Pvc16 family protein [Streptomyces sp. H27-H1]|uniref:Pvc16 family protein n=1 Tax=Streptomyces sp. H27-H1 TaxID=2996461 RepID=UPI0022702805|nr:Pvc16 family protein [Streptomyces sp. H27-H1]MCY0931969.1 Pvc16 family protein [Streptomyces sp. H27-H1]